MNRKQKKNQKSQRNGKKKKTKKMPKFKNRHTTEHLLCIQMNASLQFHVFVIKIRSFEAVKKIKLLHNNYNSCFT